MLVVVLIVVLVLFWFIAVLVLSVFLFMIRVVIVYTVTGSHDLNSRSSRSHCITDIHIDRYDRNDAIVASTTSTSTSSVPTLPPIQLNNNSNSNNDGDADGGTIKASSSKLMNGAGIVEGVVPAAGRDAVKAITSLETPAASTAVDVNDVVDVDNHMSASSQAGAGARDVDVALSEVPVLPPINNNNKPSTASAGRRSTPSGAAKSIGN